MKHIIEGVLNIIYKPLLWQAVIAVLMGLVAIEMANNPPSRTVHKWLWRLAFVLLGVASCGIAWWQQMDTEREGERGKPNLVLSDHSITGFMKTSDGFYLVPQDSVSFELENAGNVSIRNLRIYFTCTDGYDGIDPIDDKYHKWVREEGLENIGGLAFRERIYYTKVIDFMNPGENCHCGFFLTTNKTWSATNVFELTLWTSANDIRLTNRVYKILPVHFMDNRAILKVTKDKEYRAFLEKQLLSEANSQDLSHY